MSEIRTDSKAIADAKKIGVPLQEYVQLGKRERSMLKARWARRLRAEARRLDVDEEAFLDMSESEREAVRTEKTARRLEDTSEMSPRERLHRMSGDMSEPDDEDEDDDEDDDDGEEKTIEHVARKHAPPEETVYTAHDATPPDESNPAKRNSVTVGEITELDAPPDMLGDERVRKPRTLQDLYARWPIGDGEHHLRVERTQPKQWNTMSVAGYVGDIRAPMTEREFQQVFGGREYELTLYGPDPSGRTDPISGQVRVKALTHPIKLTVPLLPPNTAKLPAAETGPKQPEANNMYPPFMGGWGGAPATAADANMQKNHLDFFSGLLRNAQDENRSLREREKQLEKERNAVNSDAISTITQREREHEAALRDEQRRREDALRAENERLRERLDDINDKVREVTGKAGGNTVDLIKELSKSSDEREKARISALEAQLAALRASHEESMKALRESHSAEIERSRDRERDTETHYKRIIDELERKSNEREKHLHSEIERVRREEREAADKRIADMKEVQEQRLKDLDAAHQRELRTMKDNFETRESSKVGAKELELTQLRDRLEELRSSEREARERAEQSNDPIQVMNRGKELAEALGFSKESDAPKSAGERFAALAGSGVGQFLASAEKWGPQLVQAIRAGNVAPGAPGVPQLPPGHAAPQQLPPVQTRQRKAAVSWASRQGAGPEQITPESSLGFQPSAPARQPTAEAATGPIRQQVQQQAPPQQQASPAPQQPAAPQQQLPDNALSEAFTQEQVLGFLHQVERAVDSGLVSPEQFAALMAEQHPEHAAALISAYTPDDVISYVKTLPGGDGSSITRRDGVAYVQKLFDALSKMQVAATQQSQPEPVAQAQTA